MASSRHEERLDAAREEERRLEAELFGNENTAEKEEEVLETDDGLSPEESSNGNGELTDEPDLKEIVPEDTTVKPSETERLRKELADATHRYNRFKGSTDRTIYELRSEVGTLTGKLSDAIKEIGSLKDQLLEKQPKEDLFSDDVKDILGEDTTDAIRKVVESQKETIAELQRRLDNQEAKQLENKSKTAQADNHADFLIGLRSLVPDVDAMNTDPGFNDWLREAGSDGVLRITRLQRDQANGDYHRVAGFFTEYKMKVNSEAEEQAKRVVQDSVKNHIGPKGTRTSESNTTKDDSQKGFIKQSEINAFNVAVRKGEYRLKPKDAEMMEAKIFKAMSQDKILMDVAPNN